MFPIYYRNQWGSPSEDERWEGLLHIADAVHAAHDDFSQSQEVQLTSQWRAVSERVLSPLELAALFHRAAERIQEKTRAPGY